MLRPAHSALIPTLALLIGAPLLLPGCPKKQNGTTVKQPPRLPPAEAKRVTQVRTVQVRDALMLWRIDPNTRKVMGFGGCPRRLSELETRVGAASLKDAWGKELVHRCETRLVCVHSPGPNGVDDNGRGDDIKACYSETVLGLKRR